MWITKAYIWLTLVILEVFGVSTPMDPSDSSVVKMVEDVAKQLSIGPGSNPLEYIVDEIWDANHVTGSDIDYEMRVIFVYWNSDGCPNSPEGCMREINCMIEIKVENTGNVMKRCGCSPGVGPVTRRRRMKMAKKMVKRTKKRSKLTPKLSNQLSN